MVRLSLKRTLTLFTTSTTKTEPTATKSQQPRNNDSNSTLKRTPATRRDHSPCSTRAHSPAPTQGTQRSTSSAQDVRETNSCCSHPTPSLIRRGTTGSIPQMGSRNLFSAVESVDQTPNSPWVRDTVVEVMENIRVVTAEHTTVLHTSPGLDRVEFFRAEIVYPEESCRSTAPQLQTSLAAVGVVGAGKETCRKEKPMNPFSC